MIRYLLLFLLLMTVLGCAGPASQADGPGDGPGGPPPGPPPAMNAAQRLERTMQDLTKRLELTPEQAEKVKAIIKAGEDKKEKMRPEGDRWDSPQAMQRFFIRLRQVNKETEQALARVLSKDQLEEYQEYMKERRNRMSRRTGLPGSKNDPPPGRRGKPGGGS